MTSERERMLRGELYDASDPRLVAERQRARELAHEYNHTAEDEPDRRERILEELFGSVEGDLFVEPPFRCDYGSNIHVGEDFYANFDCVILDVRRVEFGRDCLLGPGVHVYTATHPLDADERAAGLEYGEPVAVGDGVWIGGRAVLNPGVTVGDGAVIASGAVVTEDVPDGVVVGGNPATVVKTLD
ncbi:sugar O-acetyltransferase [Halalkalicoccus sp. NIPERK01]|uniref:sugar O-acetyltransferase n=1 Tax=Halalkalicoccus sp. NIPERK01 TaxID=3053469 RepID=UPI00256F1CBB|nr:sugar O-acetyltransferase [Halalkalicoccus sp. NIPERK01]MDL5361991.1 sugar O-acetyltransferase [Halalkalicoccus sp. NIPERK01]